MPNKYSLWSWWWTTFCWKLPRGPQSFQWLISTVQSLTDLLHIVFTARRARCLRCLLYTLIRVCFTPLPTLAVCHCSELFSLLVFFFPAANNQICTYFFFPLLTPKYAPHSSIAMAFARASLSSSVPPLPFPFPSKVGSSLFFTAFSILVEWKKNLNLTSLGWEDEWSVRHSFSNASFVLWGSLSGAHVGGLKQAMLWTS